MTPSCDTKLAEMGVYAQALAPGLASAADDPDADAWREAGAWREAFGRWSRNEAGLPAAGLANPSAVDGAAVSANTAANLYDTFITSIVENHGSYGWLLGLPLRFNRRFNEKITAFP
ncbi:hypothetical protein ALI22I_29500 [Saccharothrix sp. ALI-22-I]|uniref:hypothetical protein n=1 Tax=Saccharothrix sp. ALI-22-I TaxID=1933778 RepID=UPI00097C69CE|nr:hypothetical protein [Saccharothrix sp. ALI-22-I]ONI84670.1 hypothetical protein ALI22I_29500 [Saccharothrix sp. ALI-22-I]